MKATYIFAAFTLLSAGAAAMAADATDTREKVKAELQQAYNDGYRPGMSEFYVKVAPAVKEQQSQLAQGKESTRTASQK
ncbi:protein of unknown function [Noviherbaspirillum humi]|uniref:DUF4148 domain-containing protein n=1 Tax=Noviherbaspirillum humi TaxID=1688639 RepID=A0A239F0K1_9BURK|nr:DUF4148 domain-containing protein [Noviherbaspirillum humi]SNS50456.1 protein of unknown function [Noviherbaspirillum humi]